ncbi:MAG: hypothetical protein HYZ73_07190, partial [Elusimicrobia bacterium]|nr:hypothetical protein [Elusimicrobiota bacterium]
QRFVVKFALWPLLKKQLVIREIALVNPQVRIVREADGKTYNFSDLMAPSAAVPAPAAKAAPPPAGATQAGGLPLSLVISRARLTNGSLEYLMKKPGRNAPQTITLAPISLDVAAGFDAAAQALTVKRMHLAVGDSKLSLSGKVLQATSGHPQLDLTLQIERFKVDPWIVLAELPPALKARGWVQAKVTAKGTLEAPEVSATLDATQLAFAYAPQVSKAAGVPCRLTIETGAKGKNTLTVRRLDLVLAGVRLEGQGTITSLTSAEPRVDLTLSTNEFSLQELLAMLPGVSLPKEVKLGGGLKLQVHAKGTANNLNASGTLDLTPLDLQYADLFHKPAASLCRLDYDVTYGVTGHGSSPGTHPPQQTVSLQPVVFHLGEAEFTVNGTVQDLAGKQTLALQVTTNRFPLAGVASLSGMVKPYQPEGRAALSVVMSGTATAPRYKGQLELENVGAQYERSKLAGVRAKVQFTDDSVAMPSLTGTLDGEPIQLAFSAAHFQRPDVKLDGTIAQLDLGKVLPPGKAASSPATPPGPTAPAQPPASAFPTLSSSGKLTLRKVIHPNFDGETITLAWRLTDITPQLNKLSGTVTLNAGAGKLTNLTSLVNSSTLAKVVLLPITFLQKLESLGLMKFGLPSFMDITYQSITGDYVATNGVVTVKTFRIDSSQLAVATQGTIDLAKNQVDLKVISKLPTGTVLSALTQFVTDSEGRPTLPLIVKGSLSSPSVRPDVKTVTTGVVQGVGRELLKRVGLGGTSEAPTSREGRSSPSGSQTQAQPSQPQPAQQPQNPVEELGRELLKGIFKK